MYNGLFPTKSFTGTVLKPEHGCSPGQPMYPGGLRLRLTEVRGDWKHHQTVWGLVRAAFTSNNICHICQASRTNEQFSMLHFVATPAFASTTRSHHQFLSEIMGPSGCGLIFVKQFHYSMIRWCSMHSVELGVGLFLNGGCFYELMKVDHWEGDTLAAKYRAAYKSFKEFIKANQIECSQPLFKPWMYVSTGEESCTFRSKAPQTQIRFRWIGFED